MKDTNLPILVVEDNHTDVVLLRRAFRKANLGNPLAIVSDGEDAVAYLAGAGPYADRGESPIPGLVLLDLKLPRKSGFEVLEWVKGQQVLRRIPVIVLTSSNQAEDIDRAYDLGASAYLVKPVSSEEFQSLLHALSRFWLQVSELPTVVPRR